MVELALVLPPQPDERWQLAKQMGVTNAVVHTLEIGDDKTSWTYHDLLHLKNSPEDSYLVILKKGKGYHPGQKYVSF